MKPGHHKSEESATVPIVADILAGTRHINNIYREMGVPESYIPNARAVFANMAHGTNEDEVRQRNLKILGSVPGKVQEKILLANDKIKSIVQKNSGKLS